MSKLTAKVQFYVDGGLPIHEGTVEVDTEDTGTPWLTLLARLTGAGVEAQRKVDEQVVS